MLEASRQRLIARIEDQRNSRLVRLEHHQDTVAFGLPANTPFTNNVQALKVALSTVSASGESALYDPVVVAIEHLKQDQNDKRVILLISDGGDNASKHKPEVLRMAAATNVVIYEGADARTLRRGAGRIPSSAWPASREILRSRPTGTHFSAPCASSTGTT